MLSRRAFLRSAGGLLVAAAAAPVVEPVRRIWQVSAAAPVPARARWFADEGRSFRFPVEANDTHGAQARMLEASGGPLHSLGSTMVKPNPAVYDGMALEMLDQPNVLYVSPKTFSNMLCEVLEKQGFTESQRAHVPPEMVGGTSLEFHAQAELADTLDRHLTKSKGTVNHVRLWSPGAEVVPPSRTVWFESILPRES